MKANDTTSNIHTYLQAHTPAHNLARKYNTHVLARSRTLPLSLSLSLFLSLSLAFEQISKPNVVYKYLWRYITLRYSCILLLEYY